MNKRVLLSICVLALIGAVACGAYSVMKRMAGEKAAPVSLEKYPWEKVLNLTETQRQDIKPLQEAFQENLAPLRERRASEEIALCGILEKKEAGLKEIEAQTKKIYEFHAKEQMLLSRHLQDVGRFLTVSQRETFMSTIKQNICRQTAASGFTTKDICGLCGQGR